MIPVLTKNSVLSQEDISDGFVVLINKDEDWTSFDVVKKIRNFLKIKKVGHAGTLDPFATGLMILGVGKGTKKMTELTGLSKYYRAGIRFGIETDSYDRTGNVINEQDTAELTRENIAEALQEMNGTFLQKPPMYSAKKVNGVRLYKLARKNIEVERQPVPVTIHGSDMVSWENPLLCVDFHVSKGTYIRTLAHDLGQRFAVGAHLDSLNRTAIDGYKLEDSFTIPEFMDFWGKHFL